MAPEDSKARRNSTERTAERKIENDIPFNLLAQSELMWGPYRSLSKALLHTHHNCSALVQINRKLADEFRDIARREQDFVLELSEKILHRRAESEGSPKRANLLPAESVDEIFESAISGVREFGQALVDAQIHSIEAFHKQAREAAGSGEKSPGYARAAE